MSSIPKVFCGRITAVFALATLTTAIIFSTAIVAKAQGNTAADDPVALFNKAQEIHEKGDLAGAIQLYDKALKIMPEFPEAEYQRGIAMLALGKTDEAEKGFRRAVELRADWSLALSSLGSVLVQQAKYVEAGTVLAKAIDLDAQNFPALLAMTDLRLKTNAANPVLAELLARITELSTKANPPASVWVAKAALQRVLGKAPEARISVDKALSLDPGNKFALAHSAEIALADGDTEKAAADASRLEKISPNSEAILLVRARILAAEGKVDDAVKLLDTNAAPSPDAVSLRTKLAVSVSTNPAELEKLIEANPKNPQTLGKLCTLYRKVDPAKALDYCRRASEAEPANTNHAIGYAAALVQARQFEPAVNLLKRIVEIVPENWTARANLATALFQLKRFAEAKVEFEWLTIKQPTSVAAFYFLAIAHDQLAEYMDAMANYQQYLRIADPVQNKLDIEKVNLRLPSLQRDIKVWKGKRN